MHCRFQAKVFCTGILLKTRFTNSSRRARSFISLPILISMNLSMSKILCTYVEGILDRCAVGLELGSNDGRNVGGDERKEDRNKVGIKLVVEE